MTEAPSIAPRVDVELFSAMPTCADSIKHVADYVRLPLLDEHGHDYQELVIGRDKAGLLFRRIVLGWVEAEYGHNHTGDMT